MPDHNPAVSLTGNLPAYQSFVNNAFLNEPGASETVLQADFRTVTFRTSPKM
mgnify:CR=1 FL=1